MLSTHTVTALGFAVVATAERFVSQKTNQHEFNYELTQEGLSTGLSRMLAYSVLCVGRWKAWRR